MFRKRKSEEWWIEHERQSKRLHDSFDAPEKWDLLLREPKLVSKFTFELDYLKPNTAKSVPTGLRDVKGYVRCESASLSAKGLTWIRTANIGGVHYWLWEMRDFEDYYIFVEVSRGCSLTALHRKDGLTPEQFLARRYIMAYGEVD